MRRFNRGAVPLIVSMTAPINLLDLTPAEALGRLREFALATGEPAYRAAQVVRHLWDAARRRLRVR